MAARGAVFSRLRVILVVLVLLAAACGGDETDRVADVSTPSATTADVAPTAEPIPPGTEVTFTASDCAFEVPEDAGIECGWLEVPEDRSDPGVGQVRLHVAVYEATGADPASDPLVILGGSAATWSSENYDGLIAPFVVDRDVVLFDARGWGASEPSLGCPEVAKAQIELRGEVVTGAEASARKLEAWATCRDRFAAAGIDLAAYGSADTAADAADLVGALGYDTYNFLAITPASRIPLTALRDHPEAIRSVVLNSAYPLQIDPESETLLANQRALDLLLAGCAAEPLCQAAYPNLGDVFWGFVGQLDDAPATIRVEPFRDQPGYEALVDGDTLVWAVLELMATSEAIASLPGLVALAAEGEDWALHELLAHVYYPEGEGYGASAAAWCAEEAPFIERADYVATMERTGRVGQMWGSLDFAFDLCELLAVPAAADVESEPVHSDVPTLILTGEYDPDVPPSLARETAASLSAATVIELPGVSNDVVGWHGCATDIALAFLRDPAVAPDQTCVEQMGAPAFVLPTAADSPQLVQTEYDGLWMGTTSQGADMGFRVESGEVTMTLLGRNAELCPGSYVESLQAYDPPLGYVHDDQIHATGGEDGDRIEGRFDTATTAHGTAAMTCDGLIDVTWEAERVGDAGTPLPQDEWYGAAPPIGALPDHDIPDHLCHNEAGTANFDEMTLSFDQNDDWYLVGTWVRSFIPVPAGWTIAETGSGVTMIAFSEERDLLWDYWEGIEEGEPEIIVTLSTLWDDPDIATVDEALETWASETQDRIVSSELVDSSHGYMVLETVRPDGSEAMVLVVLADNPTEGWIDLYTALVAIDDWDDYYPVMRGMVQGWYSIHGHRSGVDLPEDLPSP